VCTVYGSPCFCFIFPMCFKRRSMISWYILFCIESINQFMATNGRVKKSIHYMTFNLLKRFTSSFAINTSVSQTLPFFPPYLCSRCNSLIERISLIWNGCCVQVQRNLSFPNICSEVFFSHVKFHSFPVVIFRHKSLFLCLLVKVPHWMKIMLNCSPRNPTFFNSGLSHQSFTSKSPVSFS